VRDFAALQQDMVDRTLGEAAAHGKSRVPRADDDGGDRVNRPSPRGEKGEGA